MSKLVFVTGASGYLAAQLIYQLIEDGYRVRATARPKKVEALRALYKAYPSVEIVEVADIAEDQFPDALRGVDAVIHTASPLPGRTDLETSLKTAIEGSLNVLRQAEKAGVTKFVVTSSTAAAGPVIEEPKVKDGLCIFTAEDWNPITKADAVAENPMLVYEASKKYAELAVWEWAEAHPHVDVTTIVPPFIYGPFQPLALPIAPGNFNGLSGNILVYKFLEPNGTYPLNPGYIDIRDLGRAHVAALGTFTTTSLSASRKRVLFASPHGFGYKDLADLIREERPELADRVIKIPAPTVPYDRYTVDFGRIEEVLGIKQEDFSSFKETFLEAVDSLLKLETSWKEQGYVGQA